MSKTHDEVAHAWANQTHEAMRGCNVFFEGDTIFSYGHHFPIARIVTVPTPHHSGATSQGQAILDWWNNYLTTDRIAFDYGITKARAVELINQGRIEWNRDADKAKRKANA